MTMPAGGDCVTAGVLQAAAFQRGIDAGLRHGGGGISRVIRGQDRPLASDARDDIGFHVGLIQAEGAA
jgi:hypothetical protein